mgnify:CR=1 FL=1
MQRPWASAFMGIPLWACHRRQSRYIGLVLGFGASIPGSAQAVKTGFQLYLHPLHYVPPSTNEEQATVYVLWVFYV